MINSMASNSIIQEFTKKYNKLDIELSPFIINAHGRSLMVVVAASRWFYGPIVVSADGRWIMVVAAEGG